MLHLEEITSTPIMFAQTREDPNVEINALKNILELHKCNTENYSDKLSICLIASGGDTLCSLMVDDISKNILKIDVIDKNYHQLKLAELKLGLIQMFDGADVMLFLQNRIKLKDYNCKLLQKEVYILILEKMLAEKIICNNVKEFWTNNLDILEKGVNQMGRFELLFKYVMEKEEFNKYFDHEFLTKVFGENATKYSMNKSFVEHFSNVLKYYRENYSNPTDNYFYYQFVNGCYDRHGDLPKYLENKSPIKINVGINFICNNLLDHLESKENSSYDFVHLSNITDWLNPNILCKILDELGRVLKINGRATLRRLNSDIVLSNFIINEYSTIGKYKYMLINNIIDKSHFYSEVIIIIKKE